MSRSELEDFQAGQDLRLETEYRDVQPLFRYVVMAYGCMTYLCQSYELVPGDRTALLTLHDCWIRDATVAKRLVSEAQIRCETYEIVDMRGPD